ncbi:MAG: NAD-dependent epimerase/dehydratase family protein [Candidatus Promineifilaceae bacterium]|nr:NAD-dependent epimerase/dehydratase family protein [Candidatus Promineifilaceae bacterium]
MTRILVTGANGHLGSNIVRRLLRRGHEVVPFVRRTSDLRGLAGLGLSYCYGDIMDVASLRAAMAGCAVVIHTAAVYKMIASNPEDVIQPALTGTHNVFAAAKATNVRRIVYTSSTFAVGSSTHPHMLRTAEDWNDEQHMPYTIAKVQAEKLAWRLADEMGIDMIALCPHGILGPYDYTITPSTELLRNLINGSGVTTEGGVSFVDVREAAEVHAQAVDGGEVGQRYIIAGENMTMKALGAIITRLTGIKPRHIGAGRRGMVLMAAMMELGAKLSGSEPKLTRDMARELIGRYHYYDCEKTKQTFGFAPRPTEEMVADAIRWLLLLGAIKPKAAAQFSAKLPPGPQWQVVRA